VEEAKEDAMKRLAIAVIAAYLLLPGAAWAGASTDAALGLGAFAVFNQILGGTGIFARPAVLAPQPVYVAPQPVYVAPQPVYVAPPQPVYVAPPAPVYVVPPPPVYLAPPPVYMVPRPVVVYRTPRVIYPNKHWHRADWHRGH
jgi:hypothetical protein